MVAIAKRMKPWAEKIVPGKQYPIEDAIGIVKQLRPQELSMRGLL